MATIRKRGQRWQVQVRRIGYPDFSKSFLTKSDAEKWAREKERAVDRAELPINVGDLKHTTVGDLLERYRDTVTPRKRGSKIEAYRLGAMLKNELASVPLSKLSPATVAQYRDGRLQIVSSCTVLKELAILQHCFALAIKDWGIPLQSNPVGLITKPTQHKARDRRLESGELEALDEVLKSRRNPLVRSVFLFALATGMRRGEILSLTWENVDLKTRTAHLPQTKNGDSRTVPLSPAALETLKQLPHRSGHVFRITIDALRYGLSKAMADAGVRDFHLHDSRHEAISRFFELGLNTMEVSAISGHKDPRMLVRYTHLRAEDIAKKLSKLNYINSTEI
jgi:integrase